MRRKIFILLPVAAMVFLLLPLTSMARDIAPIVSTDWLLANLKNPKLVILDVRRVEEYREGHIPGSVNAFYGAWAYMRDGMFASLRTTRFMVTRSVACESARRSFGLSSGALLAIICSPRVAAVFAGALSSSPRSATACTGTTGRAASQRSRRGSLS